jgi:hypothetical protein
MIYDIINPSDAITIEAEDERVAQAATILLGNGKLGLVDEADKSCVPMFMGQEEFDKWCDDVGIGIFEKFVTRHLHEVLECLSTLVYGDVSERKAILERVGKDGLVEHNNKERSSMNDYCAYARARAKGLREQYGDAEPDPEPKPPTRRPTDGIMTA